MFILAVYNIKGGVGKTATTINLAYLASRENLPALICDLDPQGSASFYLKIRPPKTLSSKKLLKGGKNWDQSIRGTDYKNLDLLPSCFSYRKLDLMLNDCKKSKKRLKKVIKPFKKEYNYIFLDCPPNMTLVSENIFNAADILLVPTIPTPLSMLTFDKILSFFEKKNMNPNKIIGFFSMVESRKNLHKNFILEKQKDNRFLKNWIPYLSDIEKMGIYREPVVRSLPNSRAASSYQDLWKEIKSRL